MKLTPDISRAAYEYLVTTLPFSGWNLPDSEDISFKITGHKDRHGHYWARPKKKPEIAISTHYVVTTNTLLATMAHEMVHLHMHMTGLHKKEPGHGVAFKRFAKRICREHGWDEGTF